VGRINARVSWEPAKGSESTSSAKGITHSTFLIEGTARDATLRRGDVGGKIITKRPLTSWPGFREDEDSMATRRRMGNYCSNM
jgi:hypothetical protein